MDKKIKSMVVFIDSDFNFKLKEYMLELEKIGVHKTKADLVVEFAMIGFKAEKNESNRQPNY